jgi:hypothetical protein
MTHESSAPGRPKGGSELHDLNKQQKQTHYQNAGMKEPPAQAGERTKVVKSVA